MKNIDKSIVVNRESQNLESDESESQEPANAPFQEHFDLSQADAGRTGYVMSETLNPRQGDTVDFSIDFHTSPLAGRVLERQQAWLQRQVLNETRDAYIVTDEIECCVLVKPVFFARLNGMMGFLKTALPQDICQEENCQD